MKNKTIRTIPKFTWTSPILEKTMATKDDERKIYYVKNYNHSSIFPSHPKSQ